ncbi:MAG: efflux RND transporter periplasmic adaptor subunit [Acidobacteriia bacterium]|nr:efflux RND transporter periplasmic adaptor subunit [Terriglobia bacterium]
MNRVLTHNKLFSGAAAVLLSAAWLLSGCSADKVQSAGPPPVAITVATAEQKTVPVQVRAIGNVESYTTVGVKPQVTGEIMEVHFTEGQDVKRGQLLFTFDPRSFEADLQRAEGTLAKDKATADNDIMQAKRYARLYQAGVVAKEQNDDMQSKAESSQANVTADKAAVEYARVQLSYTKISSPVNGRTGNLMVHRGNVVKANPDNPIVTINQVEPIYVTFSVPQQELPEIKLRKDSGKLKVEAVFPNSDQRALGTLTFIDNAVDLTTGTIKLKGTFDNHDRRLWPGEFVNVVLTLSEQPNTIVVPSAAVQTGQQGQYVFVVKPDQTADMRPVEAGWTIDNMIVIKKGVQAGDRVVTDGQVRLVPGARVEIKQQPQSASGAGQEPRS